MTTTKTLLLAAFSALSLGVASANAQSMAPSAAEGAFFSGQGSAPAANVNRNAGQVPAGSSDVESFRGGQRTGAHFDYGTLANPG